MSDLPQTTAPATVKRGAEIEVLIESLAFGGEGVGRVDGLVVFVPDTLPGQKVLARVQRKKSSYAKARLLEILQPSADQVQPRCVHFDDCGGCTFQHYRYEKQLEAKSAQVSETLQHLGGLSNSPILPILPTPNLFFYRNKMEYTFGVQRWIPKAEANSGVEIADKDFALGLHVRGRYEKILSIDECHLQSEKSNAIRNFVSAWARKSRLLPYTTRDHSGFWRFLVIREGKNTDQIMVNIVTNEGGKAGIKAVDQLAAELLKRFPEVTTIVHSINRKKAQVASGQEARVLHGDGMIFENIGDLQFRISPESFFQTNTHGTELLYAKVAEFAELRGDEVLFDFYCGAGTIGIYLSQSVQKVVGIEVIPDAIRDAEQNCELNGIDNCHFICGDLKEQLESTESKLAGHGTPDVIVFDPPRAGLHPAVIERSLAFGAEKIVYVSCNPGTFARDAKMLCEGGYSLRRVQPVDMFPHTPHIELVSVFHKNPI